MLLQSCVCVTPKFCFSFSCKRDKPRVYWGRLDAPFSMRPVGLARPGPESLHLQSKCTFDPVWHLCVQNNHLLLLGLHEHTYEAARLQCMLSGVAKRKRRKVHSNIIKVTLQLQWHAFGLSPQRRRAQTAGSVPAHQDQSRVVVGPHLH